MTKEIDQKLDNLLDINTDIKQETRLVKVPDRDKNIETDYRYARENLYDLVERGQDAIDGILELSKETEHPRAYEVAGQLIKTVSETSEKLLQIQKMMDDLQDTKPTGNTTNQLFVGSTAELQKLLKKQNAETKE